jgi:hypothetical protein
VTPEDAIDEMITAAVAAAAEGETLHEAEVQDTVYETMKRDRGIRIGDCESDVAPSPGGEAMEEFDAQLVLVCYSRIVGTDKTQRKAARDDARTLALATAKLFIDDPSIGGHVRDSRVVKMRRGYDSLTSADVYAVANLALVINETGQQLEN